jgi:hypothetical protein
MCAGHRDVSGFTATADVEFRLFGTETIDREFLPDDPVVPGVAKGGD